MKITRYIYSLLVLLIILFFSSLTNAQEEPLKPRGEFWKKVRFGGGLGLNFGNNTTNITVAPSALYQPNQYVAFGPGLNYTYQQFGDLRTSLIGGSAIILANPINFLQVSGEFEQLRVNQSIDGSPDPEPFWNSSLFLGAGYRLNIGGSSLGAIGIRYNVLFDGSDPNRIYPDAWQPFVRVYF